MNRRVLMVSPHFPPDSSAATHRVRLLAPHLPEFGWTPTVLTVDPRDYEGRLDPELSSLLPPDLEVIRVRAWSSRSTRLLGFGDLGLRAFLSLLRSSRKLVRTGEFDCLFVTIFPSYPALLGPLLKRDSKIPFVLDYQDPWVGAWGLTAGPGEGGRPDLRSRLSRALASRLEPLAIGSVDGLTAVSAATYEAVQERVSHARQVPALEIPIGGEAWDFDYLRDHPRGSHLFDPEDGKFHLCYVGTLLPLGLETLRGFLHALRRLREEAPALYQRCRIHFVGTSNQSAGRTCPRVLPEARTLGVEDVVDEAPARVPYLDALNLLSRASAILLMGSSEVHYTASKLYPALLARRPLLALYHEKSTVVSILRRAAGCPTARLVTYGDDEPAAARVEEIYRALLAMASEPVYDPNAVDLSVVEEFSARSTAHRLAKLFDRVSSSR